MLVILIKSVRKLGKVGEVVNVKTGFGRNYLLAQKMAIRATEDNMKLIENKRKEYEENDLHMLKQAESFSGNLNGAELIFTRQAAIDGKLFGSVSNKDISKELSEKFNQEIGHSSILLDSPIKSLGVYRVEVLLHAEITAPILISVARSEMEANEALRNYKGKKEDSEESSEDLADQSTNNDSNQTDQDTISLS